MRQCCEPAGSGFAVVALKALPPNPNPCPALGRGDQGTNREHGLHADAPEKMGATHASPLHLIPSASRAHASIVHICIFIRGEFAVPKWPSKAGASRSSRRRPKTHSVGKAAPAAIKRDTAWMARPGPRGPEAAFLTPSASRVHASIVHICISIRGEFAVPKWPSKAGASRSSRRRPKTGNAGKAAPAAIKRDTAWMARPGPRGPEAAFLTPSASRARASIVHICISIRGEVPVPKWPSKGWREPFLEALAEDPQRRETGAICGRQARHGLTGKTGAPVTRTPRF